MDKEEKKKQFLATYDELLRAENSLGGVKEDMKAARESKKNLEGKLKVLRDEMGKD